MGYYLETPGHNTNKASLLAEKHGAVLFGFSESGKKPWKESFPRQIIHKLMEGFDIVVVVENLAMGFEAAAFAFDHDELDAFMRDDDHRARWLMIFPKGLAAKLSGYPPKREVA